MFEAIQRLFKDLSGGEELAFQIDDHRVAVAALAVHAVAIDGATDPAEKVRLRAVLKEKFSLSDEETLELIAAAREREREAVDLYTFTSVLLRALDEAGRIRVVDMLWELVYADGEVHEFEDNLVWRVSELLGVSSRDRIASRKRARAASGGNGA